MSCYDCSGDVRPRDSSLYRCQCDHCTWWWLERLTVILNTAGCIQEYIDEAVKKARGLDAMVAIERFAFNFLRYTLPFGDPEHEARLKEARELLENARKEGRVYDE